MPSKGSLEIEFSLVNWEPSFLQLLPSLKLLQVLNEGVKQVLCQKLSTLYYVLPLPLGLPLHVCSDTAW